MSESNARLQLLEKVGAADVATNWMTAIDDGMPANDAVVLVLDPGDALAAHALERKLIPAGDREDGVAVATVPSTVAALLCANNANEALANSVKAAPAAEPGHQAFWCMVVADGGVSIVPIQVEAG